MCVVRHIQYAVFAFVFNAHYIPSNMVTFLSMALIFLFYNLILFSFPIPILLES